MGGHSAKAPAGYQPAYQQQADQSYQNLVSGMQPYAQSIASTAIPGLTTTANNVASNPYYQTAQTGAGQVAQLGQGVAGQQMGGSQNLGALGDIAALNALPMAQQAAQTYGQAMGYVPQATGGYGLAGGQYSGAMNMIPSTTSTAAANPLLGLSVMNGMNISNQALSAIPGLTGGMDAAGQILNTGFDPQNALYDRQYSQMLDQQNAINSMSGVSGSAYGAGLTGDASRNFNIDWQNNQLQRQIAALGAYGQEQGQVANNLNSLLNTGSSTLNYGVNTGVGAYTGLTGNAANNYSTLANTAANNYNSLTNGATNNYLGLANLGQQSLLNSANIYNSLSGQAGNLYGQGSQLGIDALQTLGSSSQMPSNTYLQQQQAALQAYQALAQGGSQALNPSQQLVQDQATYLGIGQQATANAQNAAQINAHASDGMWSALGQAAGTAAMFLI